MSQQINLYNPIFRRQKKYFSATTMAQSVVLVVLGVAALAIYARMQVQALEGQAAATSQRLKSATDQLRATTLEATGEDKVKALETKLAESETRLAGRQQLMDSLDQLTRGGTGGYADTLRAFARQTVDGVWLSTIALDQDQDGLSITGRALRADLVPVYIDRLRNEALIKGRGFDQINVTTVTSAPAAKAAAAPGTIAPAAPVVEFTLRSAGFEEKLQAQGQPQSPEPGK